MTTIKVECTIVNTVAEKDGNQTVVPSEWDQRMIVAALLDVDKLYKKAKVAFKPYGFKTLQVHGFDKQGTVDEPTFFLIGAQLSATTFTPGEVKLAFVRSIAPDRGRAVEEKCYAAVSRPDVLGQAAWVLAHELGHLLGLAHECGDTDRAMFWAWTATAKSNFTKHELAVISKHPHLDRSKTFKVGRANVECKA